MNKNIIVPWAVVAVLGCLVLWKFVISSGGTTTGETRLAETKYLMRGFLQPARTELGKLLNDGPTDDKTWDEAACYAACLNEMSHVLMADDRCPDGVWENAAVQSLRPTSAAVLQAIEKRDSKVALAALEKLTQACADCHKAHR